MEANFRKDLSHLTWDQVYERQALRAPLVPAWLEAMTLRPDAQILEIGAGPGFVTAILSERLKGGGRVYALDRAQAALSDLAQRLSAIKADNVVTVLGDATSYTGPGRLFDAALLTMVLHHAEAPAAIVTNTARLLAPGAPLVIGEFAPDGPGNSGPPKDHRIAPETIAAWCRETGLAVEEMRRQSPEHFMLQTRRAV